MRTAVERGANPIELKRKERKEGMTLAVSSSTSALTFHRDTPQDARVSLERAFAKVTAESHPSYGQFLQALAEAGSDLWQKLPTGVSPHDVISAWVYFFLLSVHWTPTWSPRWAKAPPPFLTPTARCAVCSTGFVNVINKASENTKEEWRSQWGEFWRGDPSVTLDAAINVVTALTEFFNKANDRDTTSWAAISFPWPYRVKVEKDLDVRRRIFCRLLVHGFQALTGNRCLELVADLCALAFPDPTTTIDADRVWGMVRPHKPTKKPVSRTNKKTKSKKPRTRGASR
jgi:hypothetical protein